ncbi:SEL1-like repeat protein [Hydrogenophaga sp. IBVHS2]|uniref:SEL1-like repeat protein n=1 Tax=Hydrogenophaga sp. IBVHS2 TaxID=1985170 RepID=UPI000A2D4E5B|nr:SEL1-like repeat protein [Hydrogenophaga sp. IBVHS2]OSZ68021.1 hypothetical protein CAP38_04565 [Hydrogenophaga sp. IBVHS2]
MSADAPVRHARAPGALLAVVLAWGCTTTLAQTRAAGAPVFDPAPVSEPALASPVPGSRPDQSAELARVQAQASQPVASLRGKSRADAAEAAWLLGLLSLHGATLPRDDAQARFWFERARQLGARLAPAAVAWCAIDGCGSTADPQQAREAIAILRRTDPGRAAHLEWLLRQRAPVLDGAAGAQAEAVSRDLLQRAARAGNSHARLEIALEQAGAGRESDALAGLKALAPILPAAAANVRVLEDRLRAGPAPTVAAEPAQPGNGVTLLGMDNTIVLPGRTVGADEAYALARRFHQGNGVPANYSEAIRLYRQAEAQGNTAARQMLALIYSRPTAEGQVDFTWMRQLSQIEPGTAGVGTARASATSPWQREPTPLSDLVPPRWRGQTTGP